MIMARSRFFTEEEAVAIRQAIQRAEFRTSGEIRVYVESRCEENVLDRAAWVFKKLGMYKTEHRTGVLVYIATISRKMAVIGDAGINAVVTPGFWDQTKELILEEVRQGRLCRGIVAGVLQIGELLHDKFPRPQNNVNELSDEVVCGK